MGVHRRCSGISGQSRVSLRPAGICKNAPDTLRSILIIDIRHARIASALLVGVPVVLEHLLLSILTSLLARDACHVRRGVRSRVTRASPLYRGAVHVWYSTGLCLRNPKAVMKVCTE